MVVVYKSAWSKLSSGEQRAVRDAVRAAETRGWKSSEAENEGYVKTMASHGIKIMKPSEKLTTECNAMGWQMGEQGVWNLSSELWRDRREEVKEHSVVGQSMGTLELSGTLALLTSWRG